MRCGCRNSGHRRSSIGSCSNWKGQLGYGSRPDSLPLDRPRSAVRTGAGKRCAFRLDASTALGLRELARSRDASLFMAMLALLKLLLARSCGEDDIRVGAPVANRQRTETQRLVGYFTNMVVLRTQCDQRGTYLQLLDGVRRTVLDAQAHQDCPLELLVNECGAQREAVCSRCSR